jgi:ATP-dependent DNA ligase
MKKAAVPKKLVLSPCTSDRDKAERWLTAGNGATDGVIAKRLSDVYASGERTMVKVKRLRTADCVVGGFRYHVTGNRFRHGTKLMRWRPDKAAQQCTFDQIASPAANIK